MKNTIFKRVIAIGIVILLSGTTSSLISSGKIHHSNNYKMTITENFGNLVIWEDNFDSYPLGPLGELGGWNSTGCFVTDEQAQSSPHSVEVAHLADAIHSFTGVASGWWTFSTWQYIPADFNGQSYFYLFNLFEPGNYSISTQLRFDSMLGVVESELEGEQCPLVYNQWIEIRIEIDLVYDTQKIFYYGELLSEKSWTDGVSGNGAINIAAVELYANSASSIYYDGFILEGEWFPIPELRIGNITGGIVITAEIIAKNITAESLHWTIELDNGFIIWPPFGRKMGVSPCYPITIISLFVLGIGNVHITVSADASSEANATKTIEGFVLGIFVII